MSIGIGSRLGPYEIQSPLGEGGMGVVYRAVDTTLGRAVAIKVLPDAFAADGDRVARFEREAKTLAALNHPHIAQIYGFEVLPAAAFAPGASSPGEAGSHSRALVMELVEGPTLADRIALGPLPIDEALPIARQIAEALEAAHEQGIIHRDLKPANIKVRPDGTVKVLDFGLAKAYEPAATLASASISPTITSPGMTQMGVILGTAAYMSPEQARGKLVDRRADIWAFGCVLYEVLTGRPPFPGNDVSQTLARILEREPDWPALPAATPSSVRRLLARCLAKNPHDRLQAIGDARLELADSGGPPEGVTASSTPPRGPRLAWGAAAVLALALSVGMWLYITASVSPSARIDRFTIGDSAQATLSIDSLNVSVAVTPSGSHVAYVANGSRELFAHALDRLEPVLVAKSSGIRDVFVDPTGQWVGFVESNTVLRKISITGGPPALLARIDGTTRGATWTSEGNIIFATSSPTTGLQVVPASGGTVAVLTRPSIPGGEEDHVFPVAIPDRDAVLFTISASVGGLAAAQVAVLDLSTGTQRILVRGGSHAQYVPTGHLVYVVGAALRAVPFDIDRLETRGESVEVVPRLAASALGVGNYAVGGDGTLVYALLPGRTSPSERALVLVDRSGREELLPSPLRAYSNVRMSPDGTRVAALIADEQNDLWLWHMTQRVLTRFTFEPGIDSFPVWVPDSRRLLFRSQRDGPANLFIRTIDSGVEERLTRSTNEQQSNAISSDGTRVVFSEQTAATGRDVMVLSRSGNTVQPLVQTRFEERNAAISPDGRWIAYESDSSGQFEVHVRPFPNASDAEWQVSSGGGIKPVWGRDGRELFFLAPDNRLRAVAVQSRDGVWEAGTPTVALERAYWVGGNLGPVYDVAPDGRFVVMKLGADDGDARPSIVVVRNWFEELRRLVPVN